MASSFEKWLNYENDDREEDPFEDYYLTGIIDELEYQLYHINRGDIMEETFNYVVHEYLAKMIYFLEKSLDEIEESEEVEYILLEEKKIQGWLDKRPHLQQNILRNKFDLSNIEKYVSEKDLDNAPDFDVREIPFEKEIKALVYTRYLEYLKDKLIDYAVSAHEPNNHPAKTLKDFYTKDDRLYHKDLNDLTEPFHDEENNQEMPPILTKKGDEYFLNPRRGYQKYLGAYILQMVIAERLDLKGLNRDALKEVIIRTFHCDNFNKNICVSILLKRKNDFDKKYYRHEENM